MCRKSIYRNSPPSTLNLDTQNQVSGVILTYVSVRFLASLQGLQGQSYSFEQVTKQPAKPCPRAEEGRGLLRQSRRPRTAPKPCPALPSYQGKNSAPMHREETLSQAQRVSAACSTPAIRGQRAPGEFVSPLRCRALCPSCCLHLSDTHAQVSHLLADGMDLGRKMRGLGFALTLA